MVNINFESIIKFKSDLYYQIQINILYFNFYMKEKLTMMPVEQYFLINDDLL